MKNGYKAFLHSNKFILFLILASLSIFMVLFAPFISTRHILLIVPFVLLFGNELICNTVKSIKRLSLAITVALGLILGISDWKYADYYRNMASSFDIPKDKNVWFAGLWGWQWYAKENGMKPYSTNCSSLSEGDYLIYPGNIPLQEINENISLTIIDKKWKEANLLTFFSGNDFASLYNSSLDRPPWKLSKKPIDTIFICKVEILKKNSISTIKYLKKN
jgi:hypothetical protein